MAISTARSSSSLHQFQLEGVQDTGRTVGDGGYATVKELEYRGLKCVGKKLHGLLYDLARPQEKAAMLERFAGECELLSRLHHPCIVQFLGVLLERGSQLPVLVMEYLHTNLSSCLDRYGVLPEVGEEIGYGILRDVALGLRYLHESIPPIIHRDLSANNVLLTTNMNAKISDLGVAKILNLSPAQITQRITTQAPGTPCYMPPEALISKPSYTSKIDSYSFGVLIIHVLCGRWPFPADAFQADPRNPGSFVPISEVERRAEYLQEIDQGNPLLALIRRCLSNAPASRPEATEILHQIIAVLSQLPVTFENRVEMVQRIKSQRAEIEFQREEIESQRATSEQRSAQSQRDIQLLRAKVERLSIQDSGQNTQPSTGHEPHLLTPQAKLQWTRCANLPVVITRPQSVVIGGRVYVGAGDTDSRDDDDALLVFQYTPERNEWAPLPPHTVAMFGMGQFQGDLITVGGIDEEDSLTGKVYRFNKQSHEWEEFLKPMPTARFGLSLITIQSAIIACGGAAETSDGETIYPQHIVRSTVEVYTTSTSQWSTTEPLPIACASMSSVTISDTCYLLGGIDDQNKPMKTVFYAQISSLVQKARSQQAASSSHPDSVWKTLPDSPFSYSAAASLGGCLLAVGGDNDEEDTLSEVQILTPLTNSWVRVNSGDLPEPRHSCTAIQLPHNKLMVIGGENDELEDTNTVFTGSVTI